MMMVYGILLSAVLLPQTVIVQNYCKIYLNIKCISDSMDCIKKNVDTLFLKADNMKPDELETNFKAIMKEGEKSVEQSGKFILI